MTIAADIPIEFPLIIGDAIHNLRSGLDVMMCDVARVQLKSADKIKFPFGVTEEDFAKALQGEVRRLGAEVGQLLRDLEPYRGGKGAALRGLHDLDIDDKHRLILPATFAYAFGSEARPPLFWSGDPKSPFKVMLLMPAPFAGLCLFDTLNGLAKLTSEIIENFAALSGHQAAP